MFPRGSENCRKTFEDDYRAIQNVLLTIAYLITKAAVVCFHKQTERCLLFISIYELDDLLVLHIHI